MEDKKHKMPGGHMMSDKEMEKMKKKMPKKPMKKRMTSDGYMRGN